MSQKTVHMTVLVDGATQNLLAFGPNVTDEG
jgi:hypothetical protein